MLGNYWNVWKRSKNIERFASRSEVLATQRVFWKRDMFERFARVESCVSDFEQCQIVADISISIEHLHTRGRAWKWLEMVGNVWKCLNPDRGVAQWVVCKSGRFVRLEMSKRCESGSKPIIKFSNIFEHSKNFQTRWRAWKCAKCLTMFRELWKCLNPAPNLTPGRNCVRALFRKQLPTPLTCPKSGFPRKCRNGSEAR